MSFVYLKNRFVDSKDAFISIEERGFRFGDGVFENIRIHAGVPYQWQWHQQQLERACEALRIQADLSHLAEICRGLLQKNNVSDGLMRVYISRGIGSRGYLPAPDGNGPTIVVQTMALPPRPPEPVKLWLSGYEKMSPHALPVEFKLAQGLGSTLARMEAEDNHCFDALQVNTHDDVCETSSANIFWFKSGSLHTPSPDCGLRTGTIRDAVIRLSPYPVIEGAFTHEVLKTAHAVFITNSSYLIAAVSSLQPENYHWENHEMAAEFRALVEADIQHYSSAHAHWTL